MVISAVFFGALWVSSPGFLHVFTQHAPASIQRSSHWTIGGFEWEPSKLWNLIAWTGFFYPPKQDQRRLKTYNSIIFHRNSIWTRRSVSTCFHTFQGHPRPSQNTPGPSGLEVSLPPVVFGCSPHPALAWRPTSSSARDFSRERWMASRWFLMIFDVYLFFLVGWLWVLSARTKVEWNLERFFPPGTRYHQDPSSTASLQP